MLRLLPLLLVGVLALSACSGTSPEAGADLRVLFVGNSLTYTHDLPAMVAALATADDRVLAYETVAFPDYSLSDHWAEGTARAALAAGGWDVVLLQQGPSALPESQAHLRTWATRFADEARAHGAATALYMVWPSSQRASDFPAVVASYAQAAEAADGRLLPAGAAWLEAWDRNASLPLYGPDGFHPSESGTYLAALVVFAGLFDASPLDRLAALDLPGGRILIPVAHARLLQEAAAEALADYPPRP